MKIPKLIFYLFLICLISSCTTTAPREFTYRFVKGINVIPQPRQITPKELHCILTNDFIILLESTHIPADRFSAQVLQNDLKTTWGLEIEIVVDDSRIERDRRAIILGVPQRDKEFKKRCGREAIMVQDWLGQEGYVLKSRKDIIIIAGNTSTGVFYGIQTLRQLIEKKTTALIVPGLVIRDWPVYESRGTQIDISHQPIPKMSYLKSIIDDLAYYKINRLMLCTEHTVKFHKHSDIAPDGTLTQAELKEIIAYAQDHHIEVIGNLESFGPMEDILKLEAYQKLADDPTDPRYISPAKETSYEFLKELYEELIPLYKSQFFCVNCAEPVGFGKGASKDQVLRIGPEGVYLQHLIKLDKLLVPYRKRLMLWGDMARKYQRIIPKLPKDAVVLNWDFQPRSRYFKIIKPFQSAKIGQFICPGTWSQEEIFPLVDYALKNIQGFLRDGAKKKIKHTMLCTSSPLSLPSPSRGEGKGEGDEGINSLDANWFLIAWFSECAWLADRSNQEHFRDKFTYSFYGVSGNEGTRLIELLNRPNRSLKPARLSSNQEARSIRSESFFWEDPFKTRINLSIPHFMERMEDIEETAQEALTLIERFKWKARRHQRNLDNLSYVARRWQFLARKFLLSELVAQDYRHYFNEYRYQREKVTRKFPEWHNILATMSEELTGLQSIFNRLWSQQYRSYLFEEHNSKFDKLNALYQDKVSDLQKAQNQLARTNEMLEPSALDFQKKTFLQRIITPSMLKPEITITKKFTWWDPDWHYRVLLKVTNSSMETTTTKFNYPLEVHLDFSELLEEKKAAHEEIDLASIRVIEYDAHKYIPTKEVPYQLEQGPHFNTKYHANVQLIWLVTGHLAPNTSRYFYIYFDTLKHGPKEKPKYKIKGLKTSKGSKGSYWIENDRMQIQLIPQGGLISQWEVKELGRDIIDYHAKKHPLGFLEIPEYEKSEFTLNCKAAGPYLVRYEATLPRGLTKTINFYYHLPLCEVILDTGTYAYHNYDRIKNIRRKSKSPQEAIFSDYFRYALPARGDGIIRAEDTYWGIKKCAKELVIGSITPDLKVTHYVGPGGSQGGISALSNPHNPITHFIVYADATDQNITALFDQYRTTFTYVTQPQLERSKVETR